MLRPVMVFVVLSDDNVSYVHGHTCMYVFSRFVFIHSTFDSFTMAYNVRVFQNSTSNFLFFYFLIFYCGLSVSH